MARQDSASSFDRRQFVGGAIAAGAAAAAAAVPVIAQADESAAADGEVSAGSGEAFEKTVDWDAEYDVIVVGFGGAGAAAAITAADAGAKTLLLEKAPKAEAGGNSNICMQWLCYAEEGDKEGVRTYFENLRGGWDTPSDEILDVYIEGMGQQKEWLESLGAPAPTIFADYIDFPEFEGASSYKMLTVDGNNGMKAGEDFGGGGAAYQLFFDNVEQRSDMIDVWYEAPAKHLIQDPSTKIIHGVIAEVEGQQIKIRAKNGVVLCCGGFENNPEMQQQFTQRKFWPSLGRALYNEGDGIKMALEVNADLWHMGNVVTNNQEFYDPNTQTGSFAFASYSPFKGIFVGPDGTRVYDGRFAHGKQPVNGEFRNASVPNQQYYIWDQAMQDLGPANQHWTADSSEEMERGWVIKADTLEDLGKQLGMTDEAAAKLSETVDLYNSFCEDGFDPQFGRAAEQLVPISTAPFYACNIVPQITNTQGGPRKNEKGEVLDVEGNPIPHLYEAGELGDIWSNLYQAGNNLGGGQIFGRISGANAAAPKDDNLQESVLTGEGFKPTVEEPTYEAGENQYIGRGRGKSPAGIVVRVTLDGEAIANVEILEQHETDGLEPVDRALKNLPAAMIESGSADVDVESGATRTSAGIMAAVADALAQAGK